MPGGVLDVRGLLNKRSTVRSSIKVTVSGPGTRDNEEDCPMQVVGEAYNRAPHSDPFRRRILSAAGLEGGAVCELWACSRPSWSTCTIAG